MSLRAPLHTVLVAGELQNGTAGLTLDTPSLSLSIPTLDFCVPATLILKLKSADALAALAK
jgi:hypothetical protein